jgi:hypothetical protein
MVMITYGVVANKERCGVEKLLEKPVRRILGGERRAGRAAEAA